MGAAITDLEVATWAGATGRSHVHFDFSRRIESGREVSPGYPQNEKPFSPR